MVRLGVGEDKPLAVQQWQGLIAINYPARKSGLTRHVNVTEAKKLCPSLICQHVATWREGDTTWAYHAGANEAQPNIATHKVSLDPYRLECQKILALIKSVLPSDKQKVEKASIDEVFLDLSAQVHEVLLERYPVLREGPGDGDQNAYLPLPPRVQLDWKADALIDLDSPTQEERMHDWDDITTLLGSEIVRHVRAQIYEKLHYTCSAGVASNKLLSKLGSAHKKPNQQTVIRPRATAHFLSDFKFTKIRSFGGKLGEQITALFGTEMVSELLDVDISTLRQKLGDETGTRVWQAIRGIDHSEVNPRTVINSMLSAKSFRPTITTEAQARKWLRIFSADLASRLKEVEGKRRPKTVHLHYRSSGQDRSKSSPCPAGGKLDEEVLYGIAEKLFMWGVVDGNMWPCANLSLSVSGFEEGVSGNMGIGGFLLKGDEARKKRDAEASAPKAEDVRDERPEKKRRVDAAPNGIGRFFAKRESTAASSDAEARTPNSGAESGAATPNPLAQDEGLDNATPTHHASIPPDATTGLAAEADANAVPSPNANPDQASPTVSDLRCEKCNETFPFEEDLQSHKDWHFAMSLQESDERQAKVFSRPKPSERKGSGDSAKKGKVGAKGRGKVMDKGGDKGKDGKVQSRLTFG